MDYADASANAELSAKSGDAFARASHRHNGRFSGNDRPRAWIAADVCRIANGVLAEHWDVLQDEATKA